MEGILNSALGIAIVGGLFQVIRAIIPLLRGKKDDKGTDDKINELHASWNSHDGDLVKKFNKACETLKKLHDMHDKEDAEGQYLFMITSKPFRDLCMSVNDMSKAVDGILDIMKKLDG